MKIGIVGLGYVGLPLAVSFAEAGHDVIGLDLDARKTDAIAKGDSYIEDVSSERLVAVSDRLVATTRYADLSKTDAVIVAVPTPLTENREPDLGALVGSGMSLAGVLQHGQLIVLESTTYPGTTRERFVPLLEESGLKAGRDFHVAFSPERVDPGRTDYTLRNTPKVVGGLTDACRERALAMYSEVCDALVPVSTLEAAELTKLLENIFRTVNIALVNELAMLCDRMAIDIWEVVDAASTKPYGFMRFEPGPGHGRPLPARRPVLPGVARPRVRHAHRVHRARRRGQPADAVLLRRQDHRRAEHALEGRARQPDRDPRRLVQGRSGGHARVAGAQDPHAAARPRRRSRLPRPARAGAQRVRPEVGLARAGARGRGLRGDRHGAPEPRPRSGAGHGALGRRLPRGHARASRRRTSCGSERRPTPARAASPAAYSPYGIRERPPRQRPQERHRVRARREVARRCAVTPISRPRRAALPGR